MSSAELTPLMKQYTELKNQAGDALLLFRMGDFYELFGEDAVVASKILEITLTTRDKGKENAMPMAGVPHHSVQGYLQRLLKAGKKVAIGDQMEDPAVAKSAKTIVRRAITRVFTPAVQFDHESSEAAYLAVALPSARKQFWILACLDASTGESRVSDALPPARLALETAALPIRHFLRIAHDLPEETRGALAQNTLVEDLPANYLALEQAETALKRAFGVGEGGSLDAFIGQSEGETRDLRVRALGIVTTYAARTQQLERLAHLQLPKPLIAPSTLTLGPRTPQHLDILPSGDGTPNLYDLINRTRSAPGARQLRRWLLEPLRTPDAIARRQQAVRELVETPQLAERASTELSGLYDLERLSGRISTRLANPRDTLALGRSIALAEALLPRLHALKSPLLTDLRDSLAQATRELKPLGDRILKTQRDDAPLVARDGGIFARGTSPELDRLLSLGEDGSRWLVELETRERETTGISSLKVRYNRVFGYYIEITQAHLKNVPSHYQRKQTTVGAERFFTEELKKFEDDFVNASVKQKALEMKLFDELLADAHSLTPMTMEAARCLAELDALVSLARLAEEPGWTFPTIDGSLDLDIEAGRHPLVDAASRGTFVPNDLKLSPETRLTLLITGPNMGGKSTVMRQVALIVILGQIGAPVPASKARWGAVSSLHTRIGAHDAISRGQSTFMVEMSELAHILHHADERSLIVLDEIGRGTSTYDGISVAWSTLEWICTRICARTLFATHYHELTRLEGELPMMANAHMGVDGTRSLQGAQKLRFLYELKEGPTADSFGIQVARLAGLPEAVVKRAWQVLDELESGSHKQAGQQHDPAQLSLFSPPAKPEPHPVVEELRETDVNSMTPVQALNFLVKLQEELRSPANSDSTA